MKDIIIAVGSKENLLEDIHAIAKQLVSAPEIAIASGKEKDMRNIIIEKASNLFINDNLVLVVVDPGQALIDELGGQLQALKEKISVVIFTTNPSDKISEHIDGKVLVLEQDKEKRLKGKVRSFLQGHTKKMTDKAFDLLTERIKDESILESELTKLVAFVGEKNTIESKDIKAIVGETHEDSLMALFEAFQKFDKKEMLAIFENLIDNGQYILAIHSYLVNQIRLLLQTKDMGKMVREGVEYPVFAKAFKKWKEDLDLQSSEKRRYLPYQHPYYAYKLSKVGHKISKRDLLAFFEMLTTFDAQVKRGTKYDRIRMEYGLLKV
jgi:DNA polymerase III delta subunit